MTWRVAADLVMVVHLAVVAFVVVGGIATWRWWRAIWIHLAAAVYGVTILIVGFTCPLTPLERSLRRRAGQAGYDGGFVEHYVVGVLYPGDLTPRIEVLLVVGLLAINAAIYAVTARRLGQGTVLRPRAR